MDFGVWIPNCRHLATHLVLEFLSADGRELDEQMAIFAARVRPRVA